MISPLRVVLGIVLIALAVLLLVVLFGCLGIILTTTRSIGVIVSTTMKVTGLPFMLLFLLLLLLFLLFLFFLGFLFLLLTFQVGWPRLLILDEVFGFVESVTPAIGMCLRFLEVVVLPCVSEDSAETFIEECTCLLFLLGFTKVDQLVFLQFLLELVGFLFGFLEERILTVLAIRVITTVYESRNPIVSIAISNMMLG